jgi:mannosyltransferase
VATVALRPGAVWGRSVAGTRMLEGAGLLTLIAVSVLLRTAEMGTHFWIDEGLSVGIAGHALTDIPSVLLQDGSPPLYYLLLHVWISLVGDGEAATHWMSLIFAVACIPVGFWAGRSLFDRATGWTVALLTAICPFLTSYAQETRMYSLVVLLGMVATACFLHAFVFAHPGLRYRVGFGVAMAALLYTHNWAFFLGAAFVAVLALAWRAVPSGSPRRRGLVRDALVGFGITAVLYLPWVPNLISQTLHTGAPWAQAPSPHTLLHAPDMLLGGLAGSVTVLLAAGAGLLALSGTGRLERRLVVPALVILAVAPIVLAWLLSQVSPAWATRYLAIAVAPMLLMAAVGLRRGGRLGLVGLALLVAIWASSGAPSAKSNAHYVAQTLGAQLHRGDLVISTQPEQTSVLAYYLPKDLGLTFATPFGVQRDIGITDWRDGAEHFDRTGVNTQLLPLLRRLPVGAQILLVRPIISVPTRWTAPWTSRVRDRSMEYEGVMRGDPRLQLTAIVPQDFGSNPGPNPLQGLLFKKVRR